MIITNELYSLQNITIIPSTISKIKSRSECNPLTTGLSYLNSESYPIVVAPMSSITDTKNYETFINNKISCIIPRNISIEERLNSCTEVFCAFSLKEVREYFINNTSKLPEYGTYHVLIDIANGHMRDQIEIGKELKGIYLNNIKLMGGNIANPETYTYYDLAGFDYVRVGIAGGSRCLTGTQTGIFYPMASLINEITNIRTHNNGRCKVIADGGIEGYSDIIKCLALGADYVMVGKLFAKSLEACGPIFNTVTNEYLDQIPTDISSGLERDYYGMSTKRAQSEILGFKSVEEAKKENSLKTSEGKVKRVTIDYTVSGWVENLDSYLRSSMSYCNSTNLEEFKKNTICQVISEISSMKINNK